MKWVKRFENWIDEDKNITEKVIEEFNLLYKPLGIWLKNGSYTNIGRKRQFTTEQDKANIAFHINFNFLATYSKDNNETHSLFRRILTNDNNKASVSLPITIITDRIIDHVTVDFCYSLKNSTGVYREKYRLFGPYDGLIYSTEFTNEGRLIILNKELLTEEKKNCMLKIIIGYIIDIFSGVSDKLSIDSPEGENFIINQSIVKDTMLEYSKYLLKNNNPSYLYKIAYELIIKSPDSFKVLNKMKDTVAYEEFKKIGDPDKISSAHDMGEMGF